MHETFRVTVQCLQSMYISFLIGEFDTRFSRIFLNVKELLMEHRYHWRFSVTPYLLAGLTTMKFGRLKAAGRGLRCRQKPLFGIF